MLTIGIAVTTLSCSRSAEGRRAVKGGEAGAWGDIARNGPN